MKLYEYILSFKEDATGKLAKVAGASDQVTGRLDKTSAASVTAGNRIERIARAAEKAAKQLKAMGEESAIASTEVEKLGDNAANVAQKIKGNAESTSQLAGRVQRLAKTKSKAAQASSKFAAANEKAAATVGKVAKEASQADQMVGRLKEEMAKFAVGSAIVGAARSVATLGINMEQTRVSFATFLGSVGRANAVLADLNEFANATPFDNAQVVKAGKVLTAFGTKQKDLIPTLRKIGDISAGTGKDFNELSVIYGKARVAGTLYAEDINQLVEAGVPIMGEFAKALNTTEANVKKMASKGLLKFKHLEQAFANLTGNGGMFFNLMKKQSETVGGRLSTIQGKLQLMGIAIGERLLPAMGALADKALKMVEWADRGASSISTVASVAGVAAGAFLGYKAVVLGAALATKVYAAATVGARLATVLMTGGFAKLNMVLALNPIGLVVAALAALAGAAVFAYHKLEWFRGLVWGLGATIKEFVSIVINGWVNAFKSGISIVVNFGKAVWALVRGDLEGAMAAGDKVTKGFKDFISATIDANPLTAAARNGKKLGETFGKAYRDGVDDFTGVRAIKNQKAKITRGKGVAGPAAQPLVPFATGPGGAGAQPGANKGNDPATKKGIDSINGGGRRQTNVNISMGSFVGEQNFNVQGAREAINDMEEAIKEGLARVLNAALQTQQ